MMVKVFIIVQSLVARTVSITPYYMVLVDCLFPGIAMFKSIAARKDQKDKAYERQSKERTGHIGVDYFNNRSFKITTSIDNHFSLQILNVPLIHLSESR